MSNAKNAGNKVRNDVESIVKEEGYHPLVLSTTIVSDEVAQRLAAKALSSLGSTVRGRWVADPVSNVSP